MKRRRRLHGPPPAAARRGPQEWTKRERALYELVFAASFAAEYAAAKAGGAMYPGDLAAMRALNAGLEAVDQRQQGNG